MEKVPAARRGWMVTGILRPRPFSAEGEEAAELELVRAPSSDMSPACQKLPSAKNINRSPVNNNFK